MTGSTQSAVLVPSQVAELVHTWVKAMRAFQMYLPNNPIYHRATENLGAAFAPVWAAADELTLRVAETDLYWDDQLVYQQHAKSESFAWMLYKDGLRTLTLRRGVEQGEMARFLEVVNRARFLPAEAGDDLLTLLWAEEFVGISYQFTEPFGDTAIPETTGAQPAGTAEQRHAQVAEEAPPRPSGLVDLDDFDSTLYFLDESEVAYVIREMQDEYRRDVRASALLVLYDLFELQPEVDIRSEILGILDTLFPHLLNARDFRAVAGMLRELRQLRDGCEGLVAEHRARLDAFESKLSEPAIVTQLLQSLEESVAGTDEADVGEVLRELRASALGPLVAWIPQLREGPVRTMLEQAADRIAASNSGEVLRLLREGDAESLRGIVGICGRLKLQGAVAGLGELLAHESAAVRLAAVLALAEIGTPGALAHIDRAIEDADRAVRLAAVRAAGARGYRNALRRVEAVVMGKRVGELDLTEKMAFFEAYGTIAGAGGVAVLEQLLVPRGLLRRKEPAETRACAAVALGRTRAPTARAILEGVTDDKEPMVRNAALRALKELGA